MGEKDSGKIKNTADEGENFIKKLSARQTVMVCLALYILCNPLRHFKGKCLSGRDR